MTHSGFGTWSGAAKSDQDNAGRRGPGSLGHVSVAPGVGASPVMKSDYCRECGTLVEFDTDGDGNVLAFEYTLSRRHVRHPCPGA